jgi:general stress protein CsbA
MFSIFSKFYGTIKYMFSEWWSTLSTKPSFLSSKRVERFVFTATVVTITWIINLYNLGTWTATDHVITLSPLLIAAGYNIVQERNDRKQQDNSGTDKID